MVGYAGELQRIIMIEDGSEHSWILRENPPNRYRFFLIKVLNVSSICRVRHIREPDDHVLGLRHIIDVRNKLVGLLQRLIDLFLHFLVVFADAAGTAALDVDQRPVLALGNLLEHQQV